MNIEQKKLRDLIQDIKMVMLSTLAEDGTIHSRPMATQEMDEDGYLWFFTSADSGKIASIENQPQINLAYADPGKGSYISVVGTSEVVKDRAKAKELWTPMLKVWFPKGLEDPDLILLKISTNSAEYWDAPQGKMLQLFGMTKAALEFESYSLKAIKLHRF
jgi:general stress protein 26